MPELLQNYSECLHEISTASDIWEARRLCNKFLHMTEDSVREAGLWESPEEFLLGLIRGTNQIKEASERIWQKLTNRIFKDYVLTVIAPDEVKEIDSVILTRLRRFSDTWVFPYQTYIVCLTADVKGSFNNPEFKSLLRRFKLSAGLSRPFECIETLQIVYEESLSTLKTIQILQHNQTMFYSSCFVGKGIFLPKSIIYKQKADVFVRTSKSCTSIVHLRHRAPSEV